MRCTDVVVRICLQEQLLQVACLCVKSGGKESRGQEEVTRGPEGVERADM